MTSLSMYIRMYTGFFYYTIANIHPRHRSALTSINLLAICKNKHLKTYGIDSVLKTIVGEIGELEKVFVCMQGGRGESPP